MLLQDPVDGVFVSPQTEKSIYLTFQPFDDFDNSMDA
jgi:hypothetical protein